ncbi:serine hydrolase domain-containing protein [Erythrobacter rubeus]|uniref:Beta-lactamase family protein n=1 Tax=Erythrobacter rubeus TaxID=2760803 RepID=A0ABR8KT69_9SPHN|nr:serine hydrolase domain-containing protein [Erythrobacter rubeus]MBD2841452.1 beta-lactamase family protein [Erythrobacter rubeus]
MAVRKSIVGIMAAATIALAAPQLSARSETGSAPAEVSEVAAAALERDNIAGIGMARIEDGAVVWTGYWGEQSPGVPVTAETAFNTASVAKTIIAETVLRLSDQGRMSLDDPIAEHYMHPDLGEDPHYAALTPRILLSHQAALKNWPHNYDDERMAFTGEPGTGQLSYSGEGIEIVMNYLEARFGKPYPELAEEVVFEPLGVDGIAVGREEWLEGRVGEPRGGDGTVYPPFTSSGSGRVMQVGRYTAADNLYATVPGYAQLLIKLIEGDGLSEEMQAERAAQLSSSPSEMGYFCITEAEDCPDPIGFGVGWGLFGEPDRTVLNHGGNDFAEHAQVYFIPETREGLVLFVNGGNAFPTGIELILAVDPDLRMAKHFDALIKRMREAEGG